MVRVRNRGGARGVGKGSESHLRARPCSRIGRCGVEEGKKRRGRGEKASREEVKARAPLDSTNWVPGSNTGLTAVEL